MKTRTKLWIAAAALDLFGELFPHTLTAVILSIMALGCSLLAALLIIYARHMKARRS